MSTRRRLVHGTGPRLPALVAPVAVLVLLACSSSVPGAEEPPDAPPVRAHVDGHALRRATLDAAAALLREDRPAFVEAATLMKRATKPLPVEAAEQVGEAIRGFDVAFHSALDRVRQDAADDEMTLAFDNFFWVERTCRSCHAQARERGLLPASGPLWRADGTPFRP